MSHTLRLISEFRSQHIENARKTQQALIDANEGHRIPAFNEQNTITLDDFEAWLIAQEQRVQRSYLYVIRDALGRKHECVVARNDEAEANQLIRFYSSWVYDNETRQHESRNDAVIESITEL